MTSRAAEFSAALRKTEHPKWTFRVTPEAYPALSKCFDIISHDSGGGAGHACHFIDPKWEPFLPDLEAAVAALSETDIETFCIGEATESEEIAARSSALKTAYALFEEWFDA